MVNQVCHQRPIFFKDKVPSQSLKEHFYSNPILRAHHLRTHMELGHNSTKVFVGLGIGHVLMFLLRSSKC